MCVCVCFLFVYIFIYLKQVLRDVLREHEWDFKNALGSLLMFSSESGKIEIFLDHVG